MAWDMVCRMKWEGGLGIPNLCWLNTALQSALALTVEGRKV